MGTCTSHKHIFCWMLLHDLGVLRIDSLQYSPPWMCYNIIFLCSHARSRLPYLQIEYGAMTLILYNRGAILDHCYIKGRQAVFLIHHWSTAPNVYCPLYFSSTQPKARQRITDTNVEPRQNFNLDSTMLKPVPCLDPPQAAGSCQCNECGKEIRAVPLMTVKRLHKHYFFCSMICYAKYVNL